MATHFPTVPIEFALQKSGGTDFERPLPLVLVADDEPLIAESLAAILNGNGLAALTATDGHSALEIARLMPPEMLITDVVMPGMNGFDLAIEVSQATPDCEIILFSGQASTTDLAELHRATGHNFVLLVKPVHPTDLLAHVFGRLRARGHDF
jgi:CheY-like chemotaxis protein